MSNLIKHASGEIRGILQCALEAARTAGKLPGNRDLPSAETFPVSVSRDLTRCDVTSSLAFHAANALGLTPMETAELLADFAQCTGEYVEKCVAFFPGYLNFTLRPVWRANVLLDALACGNAYGRSFFGRGKKVLLVYDDGGKSPENTLRRSLLCEHIREAFTLTGHRAALEALPDAQKLSSGSLETLLRELSAAGRLETVGGVPCFCPSGNGAPIPLQHAHGFPTAFAVRLSFFYDALTSRGFAAVVAVLDSGSCSQGASLRQALEVLGFPTDSLRLCPVQAAHLVSREESARNITTEQRFVLSLRRPVRPLLLKPKQTRTADALLWAQRTLSARLETLGGPVPMEEMPAPEDLTEVPSPLERGLLFHLARYSDAVITAVQTLDPTGIARHAQRLARLTLAWCRCPLPERHTFHRALCQSAQITMQNELAYLKIPVVESK